MQCRFLRCQMQFWMKFNHSEVLVGFKRNKDFLEATATSSASFSWRSILAAKEILRNGIMWRVGDGRHVRVLKDKWIGGKNPRRLYAVRDNSVCLLNDNVKVEMLIDYDHKCWDENKVFYLFEKEDALEILNVPIGDLTLPDTPMWPYTKSGSFSVRSAYHFINQMQKNDRPSCSMNTDAGSKQLWRKLWRLKVANKIKIFGWRLCLDSLPSYENLKKRGLFAENFCYLCGCEEGNLLLHLFARYPLAIQIWALSHLWSKVRPCEVFSVQHWVRDFICKASEENAEKFLIILWAIWKSRNENYFEGVKVEPWGLLNFALHYWDSFRIANVQHAMDDQREGNRIWIPPPDGLLKINTDASMGGDGANSIAWIVRDSEGKFKEAVAGSVQHYDDIEVLEALAIKEASTWCVEKGYRRIILECDSLSVVNMFSKVGEYRVAAALFVEEALPLMRTIEAKIRWIPRDVNRAAHILVSYAKTCVGKHSWINSPPAFLRSVMESDKECGYA